jgi:hypothetical protein
MSFWFGGKMSDNTVISIFGKKGSGKSTLVREILGEWDRVLVFDTMGEYGELAGAELYDTRDEAIRAIEQHAQDRTFVLVFRLIDDQDAMDVLRVAYELPNILLVLEETSFYCSPSQMPDEIKMFVRYGRHREQSQIYVARRPSEVHRDLTAQSDLIITFTQTEPRDLEYLRAVMGDEALGASRLPKYRVLVHGELNKLPLAVLPRISKNQLTLFEGTG